MRNHGRVNVRLTCPRAYILVAGMMALRGRPLIHFVNVERLLTPQRLSSAAPIAWSGLDPYFHSTLECLWALLGTLDPCSPTKRQAPIFCKSILLAPRSIPCPPFLLPLLGKTTTFHVFDGCSKACSLATILAKTQVVHAGHLFYFLFHFSFFSITGPVVRLGSESSKRFDCFTGRKTFWVSAATVQRPRLALEAVALVSVSLPRAGSVQLPILGQAGR